MQLLIDENLSPWVARFFARPAMKRPMLSVGLGNTDDPVILGAAADDARIIVTADTDFGALLAVRGTWSPSVVMLRSSDHLTPDEQARPVAVGLTRVRGELEDGAIASVTPERIRLRSLPIAPG